MTHARGPGRNASLRAHAAFAAAISNGTHTMPDFTDALAGTNSSQRSKGPRHQENA
jgi:hypothetical protein